MAAYCAAKKFDYRISLDELPDNLPQTTRYRVEGFRAGNLPDQQGAPE